MKSSLFPLQKKAYGYIFSYFDNSKSLLLVKRNTFDKANLRFFYFCLGKFIYDDTLFVLLFVHTNDNNLIFSSDPCIIERRLLVINVHVFKFISLVKCLLVSGECAWLPVLSLTKNHYLCFQPWILRQIYSSYIFQLVFNLQRRYPNSSPPNLYHLAYVYFPIFVKHELTHSLSHS